MLSRTTRPCGTCWILLKKRRIFQGLLPPVVAWSPDVGRPRHNWAVRTYLPGAPGSITLYALRQELLGRRQSSGGRPGIEGTSFRAKIPLGQRDWQRLESLAATLSAEGFSPSAGQVGSVLLSLALRSLTEESPASEREQASSTEALAKELAARLAAEKSR